VFTALPPTPVPSAQAPPRIAPLRLVRGVSRSFEDGQPYRLDPEIHLLEEYLRDLTRLHGVSVRPEFDLATARRTTFVEMAEALLPSLGITDARTGMVALAHQSPDADFRWSPPCRINDLLPGAAVPFAVTDQGSAAPFAALRFVSAYLTGAGIQRALVMAADQANLAYGDLSRPEDRIDGDAMAAFLVEPGDPGPGVPVSSTVVPAEGLPDAVPALLDRLAVPLGSTLVVAGPFVDPRSVPTAVGGLAQVEPGMPCSGGWTRLLDQHRADPRLPYAALLDFAPRRSLLSLALLDLRGATIDIQHRPTRELSGATKEFGP
jgi:hypothetical protein